MRTRILLPAALAALTLLPLACTPDPVEGQNPGECVDGADNDEDGLFDCADPDCVPAPACAGDDDDAGDDDTIGDDDTGDDDTLHGDDDDHGDDDSAGGPGDDDSAGGPGDDDDTANPGEWQNPGDCSDGIDNDGDTLIDCKDPDCGNESSECGGDDDDDDDSGGSGDDDDSAGSGDDDDSTSAPVEDCSNGIDDDGDGSADCLDGDCTGDPSCGSAFTGPTIDSAGPCPIAASATSDCTMAVGNPDDTSVDHISPGDIGLIVAVVDITHPAVEELTLSLVGDGGTVVLVTAGAVSGENFTGTVFIDNMSCGGNCPQIGQGSAPFTGDHSPEQSLSSLTGFNINGTWSLSVVNTGTTAGTIDNWSIGADLQ